VLRLRNILLASVCVAALAVFAPEGRAQVPASGSLTDTLIATYSTSATLQAQRSQLKALNERYSQAMSNFRPTVSANASAGILEEETDFQNSNTSSSRTPKNGDISIQQPVFRGGRSVAEKNAAMADIMAGRAELSSVEQQVLLDAITAHMTVLQTAAVVSLNQKNDEVLRRNLEATRDRFRVGEVTLTDVAQAESRLARANADLIQAQGDLTNARANYRRVVGVDAPAQIQRPDTMPPLPMSVDEAMKIAAQESPRVRVASFQKESADYQVREAKGALYPEVRVDGSASKAEDGSAFSTSSDVMQATARLSIPLYQAGFTHSRVRQAQQTAAQRRSLMLDENRAASEAVIQSWSGLDTAKARIGSFGSAIKAAEIALDGVRQEAMAGTRTVLDVLNAEQELLDARVSMISAERDQSVAQYRVLASVGRLSPRALGLPVQSYDPNADFEAVKDKWFGFADETVDGK
jgi:outer membrane protein